MKKINVKEMPLATLIIVGILASVISFVYYFVFKNPYEIIYWIICIIDFLLFVLNAYRVVESFDLTKSKTVIFTILTMMFFIAFCEIVVFAFTVDSNIMHTFELFLNVLRVALFLSPSLILLIPVMMFIAEIMS